jgi:hypothetical protein
MEPAGASLFLCNSMPSVSCARFQGGGIIDQADARNYAARLVEELLLDKSYKGMGFEVAVRDDQGEELFVVPFESPHLH